MNITNGKKDLSKCYKHESKCCANNYFSVENNRCEPCPPGTIGVNCAVACPPNYYGLLCKLKCNCGKDIPCSPVTGCVAPTPLTARRQGRTNVSSSSIINANYTVTHTHSAHILQATENDPMEATIGIYEDVAVNESDYADLKRQTSEYRRVQLRIPNLSHNSIGVGIVENNYEEYELSSCFDKNGVETSCDMSNVHREGSYSAHEMTVSYPLESDPGYDIARFEVQVHAEPE